MSRTGAQRSKTRPKTSSRRENKSRKFRRSPSDPSSSSDDSSTKDDSDSSEDDSEDEEDDDSHDDKGSKKRDNHKKNPKKKKKTPKRKSNRKEEDDSDGSDQSMSSIHSSDSDQTVFDKVSHFIRRIKKKMLQAGIYFLKDSVQDCREILKILRKRRRQSELVTDAMEDLSRLKEKLCNQVDKKSDMIEARKCLPKAWTGSLAVLMFHKLNC